EKPSPLKSKNTYRVIVLEHLRHLSLPSSVLLNSPWKVSIPGYCPAPATLQIEPVTIKKGFLITLVPGPRLPVPQSTVQGTEFCTKANGSNALIRTDLNKSSMNSFFPAYPAYVMESCSLALIPRTVYTHSNKIHKMKNHG
ncbi:MAG TPA: hypothetical protein VEZ17_14960, partial [Chitinophagaceae bacterium]|nr:hypothetical protein [Chitinophagaceae bacterium]